MSSRVGLLGVTGSVVTAIVPGRPALVYTTLDAPRAARISEMGVTVGDSVTLTVTEVAGYVCWSESSGQTGFVHCYEWSWDRPIPDADVPLVGRRPMAKVIHLADELQDEYPLDMACGGRIKVNFAASPNLLRPQPEGTDG